MGTLLSLSKGWTIICLNASEIGLIIFGALLAFGLVAEFRLDHNPPPGLKPPSKKRKRLKKFYESLVIIGVAGEMFADGAIFLCGSRLQTINERETSAAIERAGIAVKEAGQANERAANIESNNLALRSKVVELESKSRWRTLSPEQKSAFVDLTRNFLKMPIRIRMANNANAETESYANVIRQLLDSAGFVETNQDLAIAHWPPESNILWTGTGPELPPIVFLNNISTLGKIIDLRNAQERLKSYPSYLTNTSVRTEFTFTRDDSQPEAYVTDSNGCPFLHVKCTDSAPFIISGLQAVQSAFEAIGVQSAWMTSTNIPIGICEVFVNPK